MARPAGGRCPGRPGEERGQLVRLRGVVDRVGAQALVGRRVREVLGVVALELRERRGLRSGVGEGVGLLVVAIGLEVGDRLLAGPVGPALAVLALDRFGGAVEVVGRVVGPEVGAVAEDRAVLHQPVVEEDLLAAADVLAGEERLALGVDHSLGDRRGRRCRSGRRAGRGRRTRSGRRRSRPGPTSSRPGAPAVAGSRPSLRPRSITRGRLGSSGLGRREPAAEQGERVWFEGALDEREEHALLVADVRGEPLPELVHAGQVQLAPRPGGPSARGSRRDR